MSAKLSQALEFANYRVTLNNQKQALKAKTQSLLSYSINGGTFTIDRTLISFCQTLIDQGDTEAVLLDIYDNPIKIQLTEFQEEILSRYQEVTNEYFAEYSKLAKARKVQSILDINES